MTRVALYDAKNGPLVGAGHRYNSGAAIGAAVCLEQPLLNAGGTAALGDKIWFAFQVRVIGLW